MAYTFAHMELHSRKGGKSGSVAYVLDEAERLEGACPHVPNPAPPELVYGLALADLRALHDDRVADARVTLEGGRERKVRQDQNTMMSVVLSFPGELASADSALVREWEERTLTWLRKEAGTALKTVVRHIDEKHPHLHAYVVPEGRNMLAASMHPGFSAKAAALAAGGDNAVGDRAYREAMRAWQDRYWTDVGLPCGLARIGPGRRRLTRAQWHQEKKAHTAVREARRIAKRLEDGGRDLVERSHATAAAVAAAAKAEADRVQARAGRAWFEAKNDRDAAAQELRSVRTIAGRIGSLFAALRSTLSGHDRKIEERVRQDAAVAIRALEVDVDAKETSAEAARREVQKMKTSLAEKTAEIALLRRENAALQRPQNAQQQSVSFRPI